MIIGYARTSTLEQAAGLEAQVRDLTAAGCGRLFTEQVSSIAQREQLEAALDFVREGDVLAQPANAVSRVMPASGDTSERRSMANRTMTDAPL